MKESDMKIQCQAQREIHSFGVPLEFLLHHQTESAQK